jgi:hypothetical protein
MIFFKMTLACLLAIGFFNLADTAMTMYLQIGPVYACSSDKDVLPAEIEKHCKRLTKGQWWHK